MHRGFIPVLPHCIGKCNSLAWELGRGLVLYEDRKTRRGGWDSHPWRHQTASPPRESSNSARTPINNIFSSIFFFFLFGLSDGFPFLLPHTETSTGLSHLCEIKSDFLFWEHLGSNSQRFFSGFCFHTSLMPRKLGL